MADYGQSFRVCQILSHAHLQVVGLTQIPTNMLEARALDKWYNLWMRVKGPHNCMVTDLGLRVKWRPYYMVESLTYES